MSYTPDDQKIEQPLEELLSAIEGFRNVLWARIKTPSEWAAQHIADAREEIKSLTELELRLRRDFE